MDSGTVTTCEVSIVGIAQHTEAGIVVAGVVGTLGLGVAAEVALLSDATPAVIAEEALDLALIGLVVAAL